MTTKKAKIGFVFIHGVGLRNRVWSHVVNQIEGESILAEYPGRAASQSSTQNLQLADYTNEILAQISHARFQRMILVAHSIGGVIGLEVARRLGERVAGFVGVGATIPAKGGSFLSAQPFFDRQIASFVMKIAGTRVPDSLIRKSLCNDLSADVTDQVVRDFIPESIEIYRTPIPATLPGGVRAYIRLLKDHSMKLKTQEKMIRNLQPDQVFTMETGHLPMLARPDQLAGILNQFRERIDPEKGEQNEK